LFEKGEKRLAHLLQTVLFVETRVADELVLRTGWLAAVLTVRVARPEEIAAVGALLPDEPLLLEILQSVLRFERTHAIRSNRRSPKTVASRSERSIHGSVGRFRCPDPGRLGRR